jgi:3'-phosphoadenosine 5'-phosphosulfate sulfotransferase (PAPS reductase)/FAD synthetase
MKQAFAKYLEDNKHIKAILVGTRRTDPHGGLLTHFDMTDGGWPRFMRVHPVIDWHYREIWGVCYLLFSLPSFSFSFSRSRDSSHSCKVVLKR